MSRRDELTNKTVDSFEESTGRAPNDYEFAEIKVAVSDYLKESDEESGKK